MRDALANNLLLGRLGVRDRHSLLTVREPVKLLTGTRVMIAGQRLTHVYFPIDCAISLLIETANSPLLEIGLIGREGMLGVPLILGGRQTSVSGIVQAPGLAWRVEATHFVRCLETSEPLRRHLQRYVHVHMTQLTEAAACKHFHKLSGRLARWLLMSSDRSQSSELVLTHEYLSNMLGVRRAGITLAARVLKERGLIEYSRGQIALLDRAELESASCPCYAREKTSYEHFMR
jgi:CRP-like cAMP-binding protein